MRLLLVEDNRPLSDSIARCLSIAGFAVDTTANLADAIAIFATARFAAVILDLDLPDGDGLSVARHFWPRGNRTPILVISARGSVSDRVRSLEHGADDYLEKPFAPDELVARIQALLRRASPFFGEKLCIGSLTFDRVSHQIYVGERRRILRAREAAILELLIRHPKTVISKADLEKHLYGAEANVSINAIEVWVHRLRKCLSDLGAEATIHTVRGVGYILSEELGPEHKIR